ncbi:EVE domain-containing protein [Kamptonema cortianum]|uniref:EVE domain-containing protein n=1 Tax=Geitlerinema calcuttense NRMC-F 0142 TaxID=2922238 RepID=A0ABT7LZZ0_9CYAN|nr:EVE domain-containing protein [Geitlerinema calcuttense]MDK3157543.1 EVE domain-containing protein [Kamptonema cortianum]MDL5056955.1 EVE domain-containing protein [Geitlerinema calcuttense NRMC-F 0142]
MKQYWLVKQEPDAYSWEQFLKDKKTDWTGVRNFQARNNLRAMKKGDQALYYHSNTGKEIVGVAEVSREAFPDPTATEAGWDCVELKPVKTLKRTVPLETIKTDKILKETALIKQSRLSVMPLTPAQFARALELGK